jgi:protein CpxP
MKIRTYAIALALAGAPVVLAAQQTTPQGRADQRGAWEDRRGGRGMQGERQGGYQALLRYRQQLGLSDAQVSRLQSIQQRLQSRNEPIVQRIDAARRQAGLPDFRARRGEDGQQQRAMRRQQRGERPQLTDQQREAFRRFREQTKSLQEQLRQNRQEAMRDAQAVLTPQQRTQVQQLIREHRAQRGERGQRHGRFRGQRDGQLRRP